jgi:hypothetical protein
MYEAPYLRPVTDVRSVSAAVAIAVAQAADHHGLAEEPLTDPKIYGPHANEELVGEALAPASGPAVIAQGSAGTLIRLNANRGDRYQPSRGHQASC